MLAGARTESRVMTPKQERAGAQDSGVLERTFTLSVLLKGLDGVLELAGGALLLAVSPATLNRLALHLTQHELSKDPHDVLSHRLLHLTANLHNTRSFGAAYLMSHGVAKVILVVALLRNRRWAYPATLVFLGAFVIYQVYRITYQPSIGLALLTVFDVFIMWLVWREYQVRWAPGGAKVNRRREGRPGP